MTQTHEDRVADRPHYLCAAYGCPLHGSMTSSTSGGDEWYCPIHFGQSFGVMQALTAEINRHQAMAQALNGIREGSLLAKSQWPALARQLIGALKAAGEDDLAPIKGERAKAWMARIEAALREHCAPLMHAAPQPVQGHFPQGETWSHMQFDIPEF